MIRPKPKVWQRVCAELLGATAISVVGLCAWPYTVDDAYIVARYAVRVSRGLGYNFSAGPATDGVTGPAWLLPGISAVRLGVDPVVAAKVVGLVCAALAAWISIRAQQSRARGSVLSWLTLALLACQPSFGGYATAGMETGAAALAVAVASTAAAARPRPNAALLGLAVAALAFVRPELAGVALSLLVTCSVRLGVRQALPAWALAGTGAVLVCAFRWHLSGNLLPLSWHAKAGSLRDGFEYSVRALPILTGGLGGLLALAGALLGQGRDRARAASLLVHVICVTLAGGDWMPGFRLFVPILPQYAQLAAVGAERVWWRSRRSNLRGPRRLVLRRVSTCVALGFACGVPLLDLALRIPEWRAAGEARERVGVEIATRLRHESRRVALVDIGFLGYASDCDVIDLAGITDPEVAAMAGGHLDKHIPSPWLATRAPDTVLLHSSLPPLAAEDGRLLRLHGYPVEMRIARSAWLQREFRVAALYPYAPGYHYVLLHRLPP